MKLGTVIKPEHQIALLITKLVDGSAFSANPLELGVEEGGRHHDLAEDRQLLSEENRECGQETRLGLCNGSPLQSPDHLGQQ